MSEMIEAAYTQVAERSLDTITAEIITITQQTQAMILHSAIEVGRRLCEAKEQVPHGEWGDYLKNKVDFSSSTANNFMRIFKEYGDNQISLFGDAKSQTFGNLTYSKAVALFAVPEDERKNFVAENDVENISVAELRKIIAERDSQLAEKEQQISDAQKEKRMLSDNMELLRGELLGLREQSHESNISDEELENMQLEAEKKANEKAMQEAQAEIDRIKAEAAEKTAKLTEKQKMLEDKLKAAKESAKTSAEKAVAEEKKKISELEEQLKKAQTGDAAAAAELKSAQDRAAELEKKLKLVDSDSTRFAVYFDDFQATFNKMTGLLVKIQQAEPEKAEKLKSALRSALDMLKEKGK